MKFLMKQSGLLHRVGSLEEENAFLARSGLESATRVNGEGKEEGALSYGGVASRFFWTRNSGKEGLQEI